MDWRSAEKFGSWEFYYAHEQDATSGNGAVQRVAREGVLGPDRPANRPNSLPVSVGESGTHRPSGGKRQDTPRTRANEQPQGQIPLAPGRFGTMLALA